MPPIAGSRPKATPQFLSPEASEISQLLVHGFEIQKREWLELQWLRPCGHQHYGRA
jgi:hypothetical protein